MTTHQVRHCPFEVSSCGTVHQFGRLQDEPPIFKQVWWAEVGPSFHEDGWYVLISFIEQEKVTPANPAQILGPFPNSVIDRRYLVVLLLWLWSGFIMFYWFFLTSSWCVVDLLLISCWRCCWRCWCCWGCLLCCYWAFWVVGLVGSLVRWLLVQSPGVWEFSSNGALLGRWLHQATCGCGLKKDAKLTGA